MKTLIISILTALTFLLADNDKPKPLSIEKAAKEQIVEVNLTGKGGYQEDCISLTIKSLIKKDTLIYIESGRRLLSEDTTLQDILIIHPRKFLLTAGEEKKMSLYGFCSQANHHSPGLDDSFSVGKMADTALVILANYLNKNPFPAQTMQGAIWAISNDHSLNSIHDDNKANWQNLQKLHALVARLKGKNYEMPWYTIRYKEDTARVFSNIPVELTAHINFELWQSSPVALILYTPRGRVLKRLIYDAPYSPGGYEYHFDLNVRKWKKGKYRLSLFVNHQRKWDKFIQL